MHEGPAGGNRHTIPFLICRCGATLCALPLSSVVETMRPLALEQLADMPAFVLGVSVIRGAVVPIVDAAKLLGSQASGPPQRIVTLRAGERCIGVAVESVVGVRALPAGALDRIPPLLAGEAGAATIAAISTLDAQLLLVLQGARLVPESVWQSIDAEVAPA